MEKSLDLDALEKKWQKAPEFLQDDKQYYSRDSVLGIIQELREAREDLEEYRERLIQANQKILNLEMVLRAKGFTHE